MEIEFDPRKDAANLAKHGVSLAAAAEMELETIVPDHRFDYAEARFNGFGRLQGETYAVTFTMRAGRMRVISLRRARAKEYRRHVL